MTFHDAYRNTTDWKRRTYLVSMYHNSRLAHSKEWRLTDTAQYFQASIGAISEALNLNEHWDEIKDCKSRNQALEKIKNGKDMGTTTN